MMDQKSINSIVSVIQKSNMSDLDIRSIELRPITCEIGEDGRELHSVQSSIYDSLSLKKTPLSEAWIAGNLLLFTVFNGVMENRYGLQEGDSFRQHYNSLPQSSDLQIIEKNCYRVFKIIRNSIQHNLSSVQYNAGAYNIAYTFQNTNYALQINRTGMINLYTALFNSIVECAIGMYPPYITTGHFQGIMRTLHDEMIQEICNLSDDIGANKGTLIPLPTGSISCLKAVVRYPVNNPTIISEDNTSIVFRHIENNVPNAGNLYSTDYMYSDYLLPQEIGHITWGKGAEEDILEKATIRFEKSCLTDDWKMIQ